MKRAIDPKMLYFGTPVVLVSSLNEDGTTNLAPMSSAWWWGAQVSGSAGGPPVQVGLGDHPGGGAADGLVAGGIDTSRYSIGYVAAWSAGDLASRVAGFRQWQAKGRQVRQGERAIRI